MWPVSTMSGAWAAIQPDRSLSPKRRVPFQLVGEASGGGW
jgi:hypothetical protein